MVGGGWRKRYAHVLAWCVVHSGRLFACAEFRAFCSAGPERGDLLVHGVWMGQARGLLRMDRRAYRGYL
eukprot:1185322-Prorocentrum_minimum.AAC.1